LMQHNNNDETQAAAIIRSWTEERRMLMDVWQ
jgi:hypothetical protein